MREAVQSGLEMFKYNLDIEQQSIIQMDTCLASWRSDDRLTTYLIAQSSYSNASYCLVYNPFFSRDEFSHFHLFSRVFK
jgi:hypothetical protein